MRFRLEREWPSLISLIALYVLLAFTAPQIYSAGNLRDLALTNISVLLVAVGMTFIIVLGQIDVSVGSLFAVISVGCGLLSKAGVPIFLLPVLAIAMGCVLGAINGVFVSFLRAPSIVITLATMVAWREALRWATAGSWVEGLPRNFQWFGLGQQGGEVLILASAAILFIALAWASNHISAFRAIYATGSDNEAARLAGIPVSQVVFWVFVFIGALTGIAAMLNAVRFSDVPANGGINLELEAIAAVVVGGTPITGGRGSLVGTLIGVVLLGSIGPALTFLGLNPYWEKAIQGAIILITVLLEALNLRRRKRLAAA